MTRVAIVGYGNIGSYAVDAVKAAPDMELACIVRRGGGEGGEIGGVPVARELRPDQGVDAAILCTPTRSVEETAKKYLAMGINTVDSFDEHSSIVALRRELGAAAKAAGAVAVLSAGWDPGSDSMVRALMQAIAPAGITYTNFGPGMSMGHSVAAKGKEGVVDALSVTIPLGTGVHRRMVYVQLQPGADIGAVTAAIQADSYFAHDETHVIPVDRVEDYIDRGHGVNMTRKGVSGATQNQRFEWNMSINNPALTSQVMVAAARASMLRQPGAYTLIELPVIDLLPGDREELIRRLV